MTFDTNQELIKQKWQTVVAKYQNPSVAKSIGQILNSVGLYLVMWVVLYWSLSISYWLTLPLTIIAAGFMVRIFIILHDCGHGSFFKSQKWNDIVGSICGVLSFTPYFQWRHDHAIHHATSGHLDRRGTGDVMTLTVAEYMALSWWGKIQYRVYRHPLFMFGFAPAYVFLISHRIITATSTKPRERNSVHYTNLGLLVVFLIMSYFIGWQAYLLIQIPIVVFAATAGVWLFYVQHQFEETYWEHQPDWKYVLAALEGSSYYKLPKVLQWFTGNIGFHHIHHLSPLIPNYNLEKCQKENPIFQEVNVITFWESFKTTSYNLWDEETQRLIGFRELKKVRNNS